LEERGLDAFFVVEVVAMDGPTVGPMDSPTESMVNFVWKESNKSSRSLALVGFLAIVRLFMGVFIISDICWLFINNQKGSILWKTKRGWKRMKMDGKRMGEPDENENQKKKEIETQQNKNINTLDEKVH
jgi:hypothetical protein